MNRPPKDAAGAGLLSAAFGTPVNSPPVALAGFAANPPVDGAGFDPV